MAAIASEKRDLWGLGFAGANPRGVGLRRAGGRCGRRHRKWRGKAAGAQGERWRETTPKSGASEIKKGRREKEVRGARGVALAPRASGHGGLVAGRPLASGIKEKKDQGVALLRRASSPSPWVPRALGLQVVFDSGDVDSRIGRGRYRGSRGRVRVRSREPAGRICSRGGLEAGCTDCPKSAIEVGAPTALRGCRVDHDVEEEDCFCGGLPRDAVAVGVDEARVGKHLRGVIYCEGVARSGDEINRTSSRLNGVVQLASPLRQFRRS